MKRGTLGLLTMVVITIVAAALITMHQMRLAACTQHNKAFQVMQAAAPDTFDAAWLRLEAPLRSLHVQPQPAEALPDGSKLSTTTTMSCPTYAGPGFSQAAAVFEPTEGVALAAPYEGTPAPPLGVLRLFPLRDVRLLNGSAQWSSMQVNLRYLLSLRVDDLLYAWRQNAKLTEPPGSRPAGGWEAPNMELRGHFLGHYLSATAMAWAGTNDTSLRRRMEYVVQAMDEVARALPAGYLSAFPESLLDRFEAIQPVWAPYYVRRPPRSPPAAPRPCGLFLLSARAARRLRPSTRCCRGCSTSSRSRAAGSPSTSPRASPATSEAGWRHSSSGAASSTTGAR